MWDPFGRLKSLSLFLHLSSSLHPSLSPPLYHSLICSVNRMSVNTAPEDACPYSTDGIFVFLTLARWHLPILFYQCDICSSSSNGTYVFFVLALKQSVPLVLPVRHYVFPFPPVGHPSFLFSKCCKWIYSTNTTAVLFLLPVGHLTSSFLFYQCGISPSWSTKGMSLILLLSTARLSFLLKPTHDTRRLVL